MDRAWRTSMVVLFAGTFAAMAGTARAYDLLSVDEGGNVSCVRLPDCEGGSSCPTGLTCRLGPAPLSFMACFPPAGAVESFVYCCASTDDCPAGLGFGGAARCLTVPGTMLGVCTYAGGRDFCTAADGSPAILAGRFTDCITEVPERRPAVINYDLGNCDGNSDAPNGSDPCPCDTEDTCTVGPDAGAEVDGGNADVDAGTEDVDAGEMKDAGVARMDGGRRTPPADDTIRFHGSGGCECSVATGAGRGPGRLGSLALAGLALLVLVSVSSRRPCC